MESTHRTTVAGLVIVACLASAGFAETRKELRFTVGAKPSISVDTPSGAISVKSGSPNQVIVNAVLQSDKVEIDNSQKGNRLEIESHILNGGKPETSRVDYELIVPPDATLELRSSTGPINVQRVQGYLTMEGASAPVDVRSVTGGHVHVRTMNGSITLTDVRGAHIELNSISGDVHLNSVSGPLVQVVTSSGKIYYDGDFGSGGEYSFTTHNGDMEALVAADASADFNARSVRGQVESDIDLTPKPHTRFPVEMGRSLIGTVGKAASEVVFKSFSGKIRLKQR